MNGSNADPKDEVLARITEAEKHLAAPDRQRVEVRGQLDALRAELLETCTAQLQVAKRPTCYGAPITAAEKVRLFRSLFRGRGEILPTRFVSKRTGKPGYAPACSKTLARERLAEVVAMAKIAGEFTMVMGPQVDDRQGPTRAGSHLLAW